MELKNTTTMIIGLVVSVVLVAGLMVPVISSLDNSGGGEGEVLYTNSGDHYYKRVASDSSTSLSFSIESDEFNQRMLFKSINGADPEVTNIPEWTTESSLNFITLPLFTFKTNDGKYGIEGLVSLALEDMDPEYLIGYGGVMYYRAVQGSAPEYYYIFGDNATSISVTLSNGAVSYNFPMGEAPGSLNGAYLLYYADQDETADYTLTYEPTVLSDTSFYVSEWFGAGSVEEVDNENVLVVGEAVGANGYGKIADYSNTANLSIESFDRYDSFSVQVITSPAESGDGVILENLSLQSDDSPVYELYGFIVPTKITTGGEGLDIPPTLLTLISVIPLIVVIGIVMAGIGMIRMKE